MLHPPDAEASRGGEPSPLRIHLLGSFHVYVGDRLIVSWRRKAAQLVKLLALAPDHRLHREQVMDTLWPELSPHAAARNLHKILHTARHTLDPTRTHLAPSTYLCLQGNELVLCPDVPVWIDLDAFESAALVARQNRDVAAFSEAISLYTGDLLLEDRYEEWAASRREAVRDDYLALLIELAGLHEARRQWPQAIAALRKALAVEPAHEGIHAGLMRLYALVGDRHAALRQYQQLREVLQREFDVEPEEGSQRLYQEILAGRFDPMPAANPVDHKPAATYPAGNLPVQPTSFVGRERELDEVRNLLGSTRLLTLLGTGGCGKTRLALEVASRSADDYPDGVWLVDLAPLADPLLVPSAVATALRVQEQAGRSLSATLGERLSSRRALVILDNCEHLADACAHLCDTLLRACPLLRILATSRERLGIAGETICRVPPLAIPDPAHLPALDRLLQFDAVRLFVERARAIQPAFMLTPENAAMVAEICYRLDGVPLAIELAAGRAGGLPIAHIATHLHERFRLLTGGSRTALPRHQTLRALIDWSYNLLTEPERALWVRLAVFAGIWNVEAAEAVGAGPPLATDAIVGLLARLVDKSLVATEMGADGVLRYRLLDTLRTYAWERLVERGESEDLRRRHAAHFLRIAETAERALVGPEQAAWLQRLERQHDNLRAALDWCLQEAPTTDDTQPDSHGKVEMALRLCAALWRFWCTRGYLSEGRRWIEATLHAADTQALDGDAPPLALLLARVMNGAAQLVESQGDHARAAALHEASLERYRHVGDIAGVAAALNSLGMIACNRREYTRARALHEESLRLFRALDDKRGTAEALTNLARVVSDLNDQPHAVALHEEALHLHRQLEDKQAIAQALIQLAIVVRLQGDLARVRTLHEEALHLHRELGDKAGMARSLRSLAALARYEGDYVRAEDLYTESLRLFREAEGTWGAALVLRDLGLLAHHRDERRRAEELCAEAFNLLCALGDTRGVAEALEALAGVVNARIVARMPALQGQDPESAVRSARLLGAAESIRAAIGVPHPSDHIAAYEYNLAPGHAVLGEQAFTAAWQEGRAMSLEQAISYALEVIATAPSVVPKATPAEPWIDLTPRERVVAQLIARGLTNRQIAAELGIADRTADTHVSHLLRKLGVASRLDVAAMSEQLSDIAAPR